MLAVIMLAIAMALTLAYRRLLRSEGRCERPHGTAQDEATR